MDMLEWKQASASSYERALDPLEIFYLAVAAGGHPLNREHWTITTTAKFDFDTTDTDLVARVRQAWTVLRYDHPSMASTILAGKRLYNVVTTKSELDKWIDETFLVVNQDAAELFPELYRVKQLTLYLMPKSREIMLRCPHERTDGVGMIYMMNNLFELLSSPRTVQFGDEVKNLSPSFTVAANIPEANERQVAKIMKELETFLAALPSIGLPATNTSSLPGKTRRATLGFSRGETDAIVRAAKVYEFTVTEVFQAAVILATKHLSKGGGAQKYSSFWLIDCRARCKAPFDSNKHPMATYHWGGPIMISPTNFLSTAIDVKKKYRDTRADEDLLPSYAPLLAAMVVGFSQPSSAAPSSAPILSSLGVLDSSLGALDSKLSGKYGSIGVKSFWLADDILSHHVETFLWTWKGTIELSGAYNEAFNEAGMVEKYLTTIKEMVFDGLGIDLSE
jgi:hypothetical protein